MESLLSLQPGKIFAASRFARKGVQVKKVKYRLIPLNKPMFLGPISIAVLVLTIFIIFDSCYADEVNELKKKFQELSDRVEAGRKPEMVRPNKEVEFLFDSVIGDSYSPKEEDSADFRFQMGPIVKFWEPTIIYRIRPPTKVRYKSPLADNLPKIDHGLIEDAKGKENTQKTVQHIVDNVRKELYELSKKSELFRERDAEAIVKCFEDELSNFLKDTKNSGKVLTAEIVSCYLVKATDKTCPNCEIEKEAALSDNQAMDYKMRAVEEVLGLDNEDKNIVERIKRAHEAIKNYEWAHDYLRFGVMVNHIPGIKANAISIVLSAYPSYHRFMPGNWDLSRRISVFIAAGTASTEGGEWETTGFVYSYGLGIDLVKGVGLAFGGSTYTTREVGTEDYKAESTISLGIFLSSELWKELFGK